MAIAAWHQAAVPKMLGLLQEVFHWGCRSFLSCLYKLHQITIESGLLCIEDSSNSSTPTAGRRADLPMKLMLNVPLLVLGSCMPLTTSYQSPFSGFSGLKNVSRISNPADRIVISYWLCWLWCIFSNALENLLLHCRTRWSMEMLASSAFFSWASST